MSTAPYKPVHFLSGTFGAEILRKYETYDLASIVTEALVEVWKNSSYWWKHSPKFGSYFHYRISFSQASTSVSTVLI